MTGTLDPNATEGSPVSVTTRPHTRNIFAMIDAMDVATLVSLFAKDARVVFGNGQPMVGVDEIRTGTIAFFETIAGQHHEVVTEWKVGNDTIVELKVTYDRKDGQQVTIPCVTIFHTDAAGNIDDYRVFFDVAPIYA
jgi:ketosteroid isomerase-like protein